VTYQYYTPKIEQEIITYFKASDFTWFIANIQGKFDLICLFAVKNLNQFYSFWKQTLAKYRYHFQESVLSFFTRTHYFPSSYLLETDHERERIKYEIIDGGEPLAIDEKDIQILQHISLDARKPLLEIAEDIQASATLVAKRIKMLQKQQIIKGFRVNIDYAKLGLQLFNVQFNLKHYDRIHDIIRFIKSHPNVISISEVIDYYDLSITVHIKDFYELHILIKSIYNSFPEDIKNHMTFSYPEIFKYNYMPTLHI